MNKNIVIIGGGPAGLTAGARLAENNCNVTILEKDPQYVGGISRTVQYKGYRFDIGGHRFFSKSKEVMNWWRDRLPAGEFLHRRRLSRIFYGGKYYYYPLKAFNALTNLGIWTSTLCVLSYLKARVFPIKPEKSFEDWVTNHFGARLFKIFFKTYTEKVWGISCQELSADWAAQRIKGFSLFTAIVTALFPQRGQGKKVVKTIIDEFDYPRLGPGMMWEKTCDDIRGLGQRVDMGKKAVRIRHNGSRVHTVVSRDQEGREEEHGGDAFLSSMPLQECILAFDPPLPEEVLQAARRLCYRDFVTIALMINRTDLFPDNWIYIHDPSVKLGRIQNFNNWSPDLTPDPSKTCLGLEYFCFEGDELWNAPDAELVELGKRELEKLGIAKASEVEDGAVVRVEKTYPIYGPGYAEDVRIIRKALEKFENFQVIGRYGMHKYNNQDHAMMTATLAARNILEQPEKPFDVWKVNTDAEYHEGEIEEEETASTASSS